ncbi:MAG: hypothetical protein A3J65_04495 [Candidatus Buchananbacteria bacterium RIFCSPHIGHO2_02_FULL_45_11b]|uniref:Uncharacterized protein n=1 Tax=Candidatus Buchananbacteria bacterium RIFCSPHIGHO2_02_FULL_45_11b TaxID=1797541 RepID=A0A1G1YDD2_9BACT|nr:MAG: hypothetical protein A3J65_04495 [Candidatus Buchananbacteria bacterium RIFCSPHIGHO2_02_FULL_45_11b]
MKIVLINPPLENIISSNVPAILEKGEDYLPPLGLMYVAAYLKKFTAHQIIILDCLVEKIDYPNLEKKIQEINPDIVGVTTLTFALIDVVKTLKIVKKINPGIRTVLGGPHVNIYPQETINLPEVDFIVLGEGEFTCKNLIDNIDNPENLKAVLGLVFKDKEKKIFNTGRQPLIKELDDLPFPARELTPYQKYSSVLSENKPVTTMFTSRGCPYNCLFCDRPHLGKVFRARSAKNVVDEMAECKKMGIKEIFIYDDTFTIDRQRVVDICAEIIKRNLNIFWDVRARVNTVDEELLKKMKAAGCKRIHYGVEAGNQKILDILRKGITLEMAKNAFAATKKAGLTTLAYFMIGSPTETEKEIKQTIKFAKKIKADFAHFAILTPFPATDVYALGLKEKVLPFDYWQKFASNPVVDFRPYFWEKEIKREELIRLLKKAYFSFYFRPKFILKQIIKLNNFQEFKKKARIALGLIK